MKLNRLFCLFVLIGLASSFNLMAAPGPNKQEGGAPPPNDNFTNRTVVTGSSVVVTGYNTGASAETGEPVPANRYGGSSVWWTWTAPVAGVYTISTADSSFYTILGVYTGTVVSNLTVVAQNYETDRDTSLVTFQATAGVQYQIEVDGNFASDTGDIVLSIMHGGPYPAIPANDLFAHRINLVGNSVTTTGYNVGAGKEPSEPNTTSNPGGSSVWWSWTAPTNGTVTIDTIGSSFDTILGVYTGNTLAGLNKVASDDDSGGNQNSKAVLNVTAGTTYQIAVDGFDATDGTITLHVSFIQNDNFANRIQILGTSATVKATNLTATVEPGEPAHGGSLGTNTVWWTWTAPSNGLVIIDTTGSSFATALAVYTGSDVTALTGVASNVNNGTLFTSQVRFTASAGTAYQIAVDNAATPSGLVVLNLNFPSIPANDNFANRIHLTGSATNVTANNTRATKEVGEPNFISTGGKSLWWTWTAPANGDVQIDTIGSSFDTVLGIYAGTILTNLSYLGSDDDTGGNGTSLMQLNATAGTTYLIVVDGFGGRSGDIHLNLAFTPFPSNDNFAHRLPILGSSKVVTGSNVLGTKESGEPTIQGDSGGASVWWTWTAPVAGPVTISTFGSSFATLLGIYTGTNAASLTPVASNSDYDGDGRAQVTFTAAKGTAYQIVVDGTNGVTGDIVLSVSQTVPANDMFAKRIKLLGTAIVTTANNTGATLEPGEPLISQSSSYSNTLWWTWTAPSNGTAVVTTDGSGIDTVLAIYTGTVVTNLTQVAFNDDDHNNLYFGGYNSSLTFSAVQGTTYQIVVAGYDAISGPISLSLNFYATAPVITQQPASLVVPFNTAASFSVAVSGSSPLYYQWSLNAAPINGATNSTLTIAHAENFDAGSYTVAINNYLGGATSSTATLTVLSETTKPTVAITFGPAANARVTNPAALFLGTATDNVLVDHVAYALNGGGFNRASGRTAWSAVVNLIPGSNTFAVKAVDASGNESAVVTRTVVLTTPIVFDTNSPNMGTITRGFTGDYLEPGKNYTVTAVAKPGYVFTNWTGTATSTNATLTFTMQYGTYLQANFITNPFIPYQGMYNGLFFNNSHLESGSSGYISLNLGADGGYSGQLKMNSGMHPFSGAFDLSGQSQITVNRTGTNPVVFQMSALFSMPNFIMGTVTNPAFISSFGLLPNPFNATTNKATNYMGKYTWAIVPKGSPGYPGGWGYATMTVDAAGNVNTVGKMGDGTSISQSAPLSADGQLPLYNSFYGNKGGMVAPLRFSGSPVTMVSGELAWFKPAIATSKFYPDAFTIIPNSIGSIFVTPTNAATPLINFSIGTIVFSGGNLPDNVTNNVLNGSSFTVDGTNHVTVTFNRANGLITGSFVHPATHTATPIYGVVLQNQYGAVGYFSGTNQIGGFTIQGN